MSWLVGLVAILAVGGAITTPLKVKAADDWWKTSVFYQIYPRSFKDSNNDGIGDLKGITSKLQHLKDAGIGATWLSPIFKSPMVDFGYDISDYRDIHPEFGTIQDFEDLIARANELGIKIILDLVPNHSSDQHEWFKKSENNEPGYEDYYVWRTGKNNNMDPPNNWNSHFMGPAWTFSQKRQQWYFHQFAVQQPDLNYRNPKVVQEMKDIMRFWLDKGVGGFRVDAVTTLFENEELLDEPLSNNGAQPDEHSYLNHIHTYDQPENFDMIYQWRELLDEYGDRVMMTEAYTNIYKTMEYGGNETTAGAHIAFNFLLIGEANSGSSAEDLAYVIQKWMTYMPVGKTANWVIGNHDNHRVASRYGVKKVDGLNMLTSILPGVKVVYNGEEIGMEDGEVTYEEGVDPSGCNAGPERFPYFTRDPERTPFHWDSTINAGFNEGGETWLPVSEKYITNNLELQSGKGVDSHYHVFQNSNGIRSHPTIIDGELIVKPFNPRVLTLKRELENSETFVFVFNIGDRKEVIDLNILRRLPKILRVEVASVNSTNSVGSRVETAKVSLAPYEALILVSE